MLSKYTLSPEVEVAADQSRIRRHARCCAVQDSFLAFAFSISLAMALAAVDNTAVGCMITDVAVDTTDVDSGYANNDDLACDKKPNTGTSSLWVNPMKAVGVKARLMKYIRGNQYQY